MSPQSETPRDDKPLKVRRGRVDSVNLYEIKDNELDLLEKGSPAGLYLNFAIFLLSTAISALSSLWTTSTFKFALAQTVFVVLTIVGFLGGALLLILWWREKCDVAKVIAVIRNRIPPEGPDDPSELPPPELPLPEQSKPSEPKG